MCPICPNRPRAVTMSALRRTILPEDLIASRPSPLRAWGEQR